MRYEIIGRVRVGHDGNHHYVNAQKVEVLLRVLLVQADRILTPDQLMLELWGEDLPRRARAGLHVYISQLRKLLASASASASALRTASPGYVLTLRSDELDYHEWNRHLHDAAEALRGRDFARVSRCCDRALALWRGLPEAGSSCGPIMEGLRSSLAVNYLDLAELSISSAIVQGRERDVVPELYRLVAAHPLREGFYMQLMLALYRIDRRADALATYKRAWCVLDRELGVTPCKTMQELHRSILTSAQDARMFGAYPLVGGFEKIEKLA